MRLLLAIIATLLGGVVLAHNNPNTGEEANDSLANDTSFAHWDIEGITRHQEFCAYPAQEIYNHWDNRKIHPYAFNPNEFDDTICLELVSPQSCDFVHPVAGPITSEFGFRRYRWHYGIDIDLHTGDKVYNAFDGVVRIAQYSSSYGYVVVVRHYNGLETLYSHLSRLLVSPGDVIDAGHVVGLGGRTGRASGSHLHFEVRYKGWSIDPRLLIDFETGHLQFISAEMTPAWFDHLTHRHYGDYYTIVRGDTLYSIAKRHGMSLSSLLALNSMRANSLIMPGQKIKVR